MHEAMDIRIGWLYWTLMVVLGLVSAGILAVLLWLSTRGWPRRFEPDHLVLRNGTRIPWRECTNMVRHPMRRMELVFGGTTVQVPAISIAHGKQAIRWIEEKLGV